jgi:hypothetical protein
MTDPNQTPTSRRRRALVLAAAAALLAGGGAFTLGLAVGDGGSVDASGSAATDTTRGLADDDDDADDTSDDGLDWSSLSPAVAAQLEYVHDNWEATESDEFGFLDENDCMNFASQSLLARGWVPDDEWWYDDADGDPYASSDAWRSSTYFMWYLEDHPELATPLTDDQRDQVKVGDIVQFDWDDSGDRDHTGIVTAVIPHLDGSIAIEYAGHTDATWERSVDWAITEYHPGGVAHYWSIAE